MKKRDRVEACAADVPCELVEAAAECPHAARLGLRDRRRTEVDADRAMAPFGGGGQETAGAAADLEHVEWRGPEIVNALTELPPYRIALVARVRRRRPHGRRVGHLQSAARAAAELDARGQNDLQLLAAPIDGRGGAVRVIVPPPGGNHVRTPDAFADRRLGMAARDAGDIPPVDGGSGDGHLATRCAYA